MVHSLVYPRPLIKHHYDGHHGIDVYLQDNASPPVWWRIAWEPVKTKRPESRNSVKIAVLKTTRSVPRSMLMNSIRMTFDFWTAHYIVLLDNKCHVWRMFYIWFMSWNALDVLLCCLVMFVSSTELHSLVANSNQTLFAWLDQYHWPRSLSNMRKWSSLSSAIKYDKQYYNY